MAEMALDQRAEVLDEAAPQPSEVDVAKARLLLIGEERSPLPGPVAEHPMAGVIGALALGFLVGRTGLARRIGVIAVRRAVMRMAAKLLVRR